MIPLDDADSGMESLTTAESKESSPKKTELAALDDFDDDDEDLEETLSERLWGLTEMFPETMRKGVWAFSSGSVTGLKYLYSFSRTAVWIFFSSSAILMAPVIFEVERVQMEEMQRQQQRQILLGPNTSVSSASPSLGMPMPMPTPPPPAPQSR